MKLLKKLFQVFEDIDGTVQRFIIITTFKNEH